MKSGPMPSEQLPKPGVGGLAPRRPADVPPWSPWTAPAAVVLALGLGAVATILVDVAAAGGGAPVGHTTPALTIAGDMIFDLALVVAALYFASRYGRPRAADFGFRRVRARLAVLAVVLAAIGYYGLSALYALVFALHQRDKLPSDLGVNRSHAALVAATVFVCVIAPVVEEFFFRGFIFGALRRLSIRVADRDLGTWVAAILTGVLFGAFHVGSAALVFLIPLGFLGFVLCIMRWRTGSLYPGMALHGANNALALGVQLGWSALEIVGLIVASWLVVAMITGPLGARTAPLR